MNTALTLRELRQGLHLSYSQINTYLTCSLRYHFQYVKALPPEHVSSSLILGSAIHQTLAFYFTGLKNQGKPPADEEILGCFRKDVVDRIAAAQVAVHYKVDVPSVQALVAQGEALLTAFLKDPAFTGMEVVAVELPLQSGLVNADGALGDMALVGAIDLLLRDQLGRLLAVDHKTAKQAFTQDAIDRDLQLSAYAYLLAENGYLDEGQSLHCGFHVLRKLKAPKVERHLTLRTPADRRRFVRIAQSVLAAIEAQSFVPCTGWQCGDCAYQKACAAW